MHQALLSFNSGEVSPYLRHRVDFEKSSSSVERLENFLAMPYGGIIKRPGLKYLATVDHDAVNGCMRSFVSSDGQRYLLCFSEAGLVVLRTDGTKAAQVAFLTDPAIQNSFVSGIDSLRKLQMVQINDVAFITHPAITPTRLSRYDDTSWVIEPIPFSYPPLLDENTDEDNKLIVSGPGDTAPAWDSTAYYSIGSKVTYGTTTWICAYAHTSGSTRYPVSGPDIGPSGSTVGENPAPPIGYYTYSSSFYWSDSSGATGTVLYMYTYKPIWKISNSIDGFLPGTEINVISSKGIFGDNYVGSILRFSKSRTSSQSLVKLAAINSDVGPTGAIYVRKDWIFSTFGTWTGTWTIETSKDGSNWDAVRDYPGTGNRNIADSGTVPSPCFMRLKWKYEGTAVANSPIATLETMEPYIEGLMRITSVENSSSATGVAVTQIFPGTSDLWNEGAFSKRQGFPVGCCLHESRLVFAGTLKRAVSLWLSATDDLLNFEVGTNASDGIFATLSASYAEPIRWIISQRRLFIGTATGEFVSGSETTDSPLSPSNFTARRYTSTGSTYQQPLVSSDGILFAGRKGGRLHEVGYSTERASYDATDLSRLAEHLTQPGIIGMAAQQTREPILWAVRADGRLLSMLHNRGEQITAWSSHSTQGGLFRDVCIFPSDTGDDAVFFLVQRGETVCLEHFPQGWQEVIENGGSSLEFFNIDGVSGRGTTIDVPSHLENTALTEVWLPSATPDGVPSVEKRIFDTASVVLPQDCYWQVGLPIVSRLESLPLDTSAQDGTSQGRRKRSHKLVLSLYRSRGGQVWNREIERRQPIPNTAPAELLRSCWEDVIPDAGALDDLQLRIYHDEPFPFCLRAAVLRWKLHEA